MPSGSVMIVSNVDDANPSDEGPVDAAILAAWNRFRVWLEYQPPATVQLERELPRTVASQRMRASGHEFGHTRRGQKETNCRTRGTLCAAHPRWSARPTRAC